MKVSPELEARILELAGQSTTPARQTVPRATPRGWQALVIWVPISLRSEANAGGTRRAAISRKSAVKEAVGLELPPEPLDWPKPIRVKLTRCGGKRLDPDNLARAFKAVQDVVADWLGVDDGDLSAVRWIYRQRPGYTAGVEIRIGGGS